MCLVSLHYPAFGFEPGDGEIFELQVEFDKKSDPTPEEVKEYDTAARKAVDKIRETKASRTEIEVLEPGCGHQFHRFCLSKHVNSNAGNRNQCVICYKPIDEEILSSLGVGGSGQPKLRRQPGVDPPLDYQTETAPGQTPFGRYKNLVFRNRLRAEMALRSVRSELANGPVLRLVDSAVNGLVETPLRGYRLGTEFPNYDSEMHRLWEEQIGYIIVVYRALKVHLAELQGSVDREDYHSMEWLLIVLKDLIHALVPPPDDPTVETIRGALNSSWTYMYSDIGNIALTGRNAFHALFMERNAGELGTFENDPRVQSIQNFVNSIRDSEQRNNFTGDEANFILLGTMLLSVVNHALHNRNLDEFNRFKVKAVGYLVYLFPSTYLSGAAGWAPKVQQFLSFLTGFRL